MDQDFGINLVEAINKLDNASNWTLGNQSKDLVTLTGNGQETIDIFLVEENYEIIANYSYWRTIGISIGYSNSKKSFNITSSASPSIVSMLIVEAILPPYRENIAKLQDLTSNNPLWKITNSIIDRFPKIQYEKKLSDKSTSIYLPDLNVSIQITEDIVFINTTSYYTLKVSAEETVEIVNLLAKMRGFIK